jgi:ATP-dependent exoDNAse (exonuclease V) alpha subunit
MVGTRDLARLADATDAAGGKLVLVGDDRQLPEIEAGGLFAALADRLGGPQLRDVRRQEAGWDRDALAALRSGDVERFARYYQEHGRIVAAPTAGQARQRLVDDWLAATERGERAVMIAHRRRDVADLNQRARERLRDVGRLGPDELTTGTRAFAVGDRVVARRNDRRLGVVNGATGHLAAIDDRCVIVELDDGRRLRLPDAYARAGHLEHGYALTAHLAQGSTVDRAVVLGSDELYREWGYTALSRHRTEARFYISATPTFLNRTGSALQAGLDVTATVARMLEASRAQRLALDGLAPDRISTALQDELDRASRRLDGIDTRLETLRQNRDRLPWHRRARRRELDRLSEGWQRSSEHAQREIARLGQQLDARPILGKPSLARAVDPLAAFQRAPERPQRTLDRGLER